MMSTSFKIWISLALRFVRRHRRKTVATGSFIIIGTSVLVVMHSITVGINDTMVLNTTHVHYGHAFMEISTTTYDPESIARHVASRHDVEDVLLRYRFAALLSARDKSVPVILYAVNPVREAKRTAIAKRIISGRYPKDDENGVLIGLGTAERLLRKEGDRVSVVTSAGVFLGTFRISGIYSTGIDRYDEGIAYMPQAQLDVDTKETMDAEVSLFFGGQSDIAFETEKINRDIPPKRKFTTWDSLMPDLVQLIEMNNVSMKIIMVLVFALVGFGISNNFILTLVERFREFGILKAMGVTPRELVALIFLESFTICVFATGMGLFMGWLITEVVAQYGIDFSYFTSHNRYFVVSGIVYPRITIAGLYLPAVISVAVSLISSYLPARIAGKRVTAETLRFA